VGILLFSSACAIYKPATRDEIALSGVPDRFSLYDETERAGTNIWWQGFGDSQLNLLVEKALTNNLNMMQAEARLRQAEAVVVKQGAARFPSLDLDASAATRKDNIILPTGEGQSVHTESYKLGLAAGYEVDMWGRIKSMHKKALFDYQAGWAEREAMEITVSSTVVLRYFELIFQDKKLEILRKQVKFNKQILELIELRFKRSQATALDVYQQRQLVANAESQIPPAESRDAVVRNELAVLLGEIPGESLGLEEREIPEIIPVAHTGIPADLLVKRPDIVAAMMRLRGTDWQISAARADRLPAIRLTASGGYSSFEYSTLFDNWFYNLAGSLTGPIFDAGRRRAEVDRVRAVADERLANYKQVVLTAMREVEDSLIKEKKEQEYLVALKRQLEIAKNTQEQAGARYRKGLETYLPVLTALIVKQDLENAVLRSEFQVLIYRVELFRALGGDFGRNEG
jgi:NodT family efflux transporter outer membrane factor (OMF) lipoprotein